MVLIDDANLEVLDVAAERIPENDQLHDRERHRHGDQHRTAPESPQLAFDDRPCTSHSCLSVAFSVQGSEFRVQVHVRVQVEVQVPVQVQVQVQVPSNESPDA